MKKFFALAALFVCFAFGAKAQGIEFETSSFSKVLQKASDSKRLIFMDIYTTWCGPCQYMSNVVFKDKAVGDFFNSNFVNAKFDAEKGEGITLAKRYGVTAYPTFLLLDGDGKLVGKMVGGSPAKDFIDKIGDLAAKAK